MLSGGECSTASSCLHFSLLELLATLLPFLLTSCPFHVYILSPIPFSPTLPSVFLLCSLPSLPSSSPSLFCPTIPLSTHPLPSPSPLHSPLPFPSLPPLSSIFSVGLKVLHKMFPEGMLTGPVPASCIESPPGSARKKLPTSASKRTPLQPVFQESPSSKAHKDRFTLEGMVYKPQCNH